MRRLTVASRPELIYGVTGVLFVAMGIVVAIAVDDSTGLAYGVVVSALGALFLAITVLARRRET